MNVTAIKQQIKHPNRYSIFVDNKYSFSFGESAILEHGLSIGLELSQTDVARLKELSGDDKIYNAALRYIAMRSRSKWEMETYLARKGAGLPLQNQILNKLSDYGYIDDKKFAVSWVENRRLLRPTSLRKLQQELKLKHVSGLIIDEVLADNSDEESTALHRLITKKQARYPDKVKFMQYLVRQGFNYGDVKHALSEHDQEN